MDIGVETAEEYREMRKEEAEIAVKTNLVLDAIIRKEKISCTDEEAEKVIEVDMQRSEQVRRWWPFLRDRRIENYNDITKRYID